MKYIKESRIAASPSDVFCFHEQPNALQRLMPPWEKANIVKTDHSLLPGSRVALQMKVGVFLIKWVAIHTEYDPPRMFADKKASGLFPYWYHRHWFLDDGNGGTLLRDEIEYKLPLGKIGSFFAGRWLKRKLEKLFTYRHAVIQKAFAENLSKKQTMPDQS